MKRLLLALALASVSYAQQYKGEYTVPVTETVSGTGTGLTVQVATGAAARTVEVQRFALECTPDCRYRIKRSGTPATATVVVPKPRFRTQDPAVFRGYTNTNVGTGEILSPYYSVPAGVPITIDMDSHILEPGGASADNVTLEIEAFTGTVKMSALVKEQR